MVRINRRGFTLTEAMMTVAITGILATVGASVLVQVNRYYILTRTRAELQRESRAIMYVVTRALHQAQYSSIVVDRADNTQPFCSRLTFTKLQGDTLTFQQVGKEFQLVENGGTRVMSKNVRYLAFTFPRTDDMTIMSVSMTLEALIYEGRTKALHMASERVRVMN
ncbi:MAG: prepilin-type N-terminal cleavage/methylation domain-containing protein [Elusimicrobiota bacterium]|nr:prepilin-type N-terminal cleavage/methylation domain-containing protein [Elusimicrobiota bacterium]